MVGTYMHIWREAPAQDQSVLVLRKAFTRYTVPTTAAVMPLWMSSDCGGREVVQRAYKKAVPKIPRSESRLFCDICSLRTIGIGRRKMYRSNRMPRGPWIKVYIRRFEHGLLCSSKFKLSPYRGIQNTVLSGTASQ